MARQVRELAGLVYEFGKCRSYVFEPDGGDPWFPGTEVPEDLEAQAGKACAGCPVIAECLEMTLQLEAELPRQHVVGIFGATPGHQRLRMLDVRRAQREDEQALVEAGGGAR
ncbi:WhiB family transcriptional regulator [Paractinoplanes atraurantiacus]|uniref:Transcription factor WhiB n=1 Tax=Paractinoplanes atraurantiacus TaxID=1036182 RepID=A0A285KJJ5_9ACTN|nr:WhiB family transcriptional regulator [Actinoplanes atraurantiacus]SNY72778.1 Transcription factor WhiB [Actinoplanes atraurantiacus]